MKKIIFTSLLFIFCTAIFAKSIKEPVEIEGYSDKVKDGDTVKLTVFKYGLIRNIAGLSYVINSIVKNGRFSFVVKDITCPHYIGLHVPNDINLGLYRYVVMPGDQIILNIEKDNVVVSGRQCSNFKTQYLMRKVEKDYHYKTRMPELTSKTLERLFSIYDSLTNKQIDTLTKYKKSLKPVAYSFLFNNLLSSWICSKYSYLNFIRLDSPDSVLAMAKSLKRYKEKHQERQLVSDSFLASNAFYIEYLYERYRTDSCRLVSKPYDVSACVTHFRKNYQGLLREQLITYVICSTKNYPETLTSEIKASLNFIKNPDYRRYLTDVLNKRVNGSSASNIYFNDVNGRKVYLTSYRNQVILLDFWFTGCAACRELSPIMVGVEKEFKGKPVKFIGVSIDKNKHQFIKSVQEEKYVSSNILNLYTNGEGESHKSIQQLKVIGYPTLIMINKNGQIVNITDDPRADNGDALKKQILTWLQ